LTALFINPLLRPPIRPKTGRVLDFRVLDVPSSTPARGCVPRPGLFSAASPVSPRVFMNNAG
jgi:hypothetical protein